MIRRASYALAAIMVSSLLAACGGGGADTPDVPINLQQAWATYLDQTGSQHFTISGTVHVPFEGNVYDVDVGVGGSGVVTRGAISANSFEGTDGFRKISTITADFTFPFQGKTYAETFDDSLTEYADASYALLGVVDGASYQVVTSWFPPPVAAKVGDSGILYTADVWESPSKLIHQGSMTVRYSVLLESKTSVLVRLRSGDYSSSTFRVTTTGSVTRVSEQMDIPGVATLTFTYN